jgi:hypothetical protein
LINENTSGVDFTSSGVAFGVINKLKVGTSLVKSTSTGPTGLEFVFTVNELLKELRGLGLLSTGGTFESVNLLDAFVVTFFYLETQKYHKST